MKRETSNLFKTRAATVLLTMMLTTATAWAQSTFSGGDGSQANPY